MSKPPTPKLEEEEVIVIPDDVPHDSPPPVIKEREHSAQKARKKHHRSHKSPPLPTVQNVYFFDRVDHKRLALIERRVKKFIMMANLKFESLCENIEDQL